VKPAKNKESSNIAPDVGIIMGSRSDWNTVCHTAEMLEKMEISFETQVVSAHRTPDRLYEYAKSAEDRGIKIIIAAAGGAAHLPGMAAALTSLPVLGIPVESKTLKGLDSLLSIAQMPAGVPVATLAVGKAGAENAALMAAAILAISNPVIAKKLKEFRANQTASIPLTPYD